MAAITDRASGEYAPTLPVPNPLQRLTVRRPTPPSTVAKARRSDPPTTTAGPESAYAPQSLPEAQTALLRDELAKSRARVAELERDKRAADEVKVASFPPPVSPAPKPATAPPAEPATDAVISWLVKRAIDNRKAIYALVAALGIGGGGAALKSATAKPASDPNPVLAARVTLIETLLKKSLDREAVKDAYIECLAEQQTEYFAQLLPAADRAGSAKLPAPWVDRCRNRKP